MKIKKGLFFLVFAFYAQQSISQIPVPLLEREITFQATNEPVSEILKKIEKQAGLFFSYNSDLIDDTKRVSVFFQQKSVARAIQLLFNGKIDCKVKGDHVILLRAPGKQAPSYTRNYNTRIRDTIVVHDTIIQRIRDTVYIPYPDSVTGADNLVKPLQAKSRVGFTAGLSMVNITGISSTFFTAGGYGGVYATLTLSERMYLQPEIVFSVKGYRYSAKEDVASYTISTDAVQRFFYVETPLMLNIHITPRFYTFLGPYVGFLTGSSFSVTTSVNGILNHRDRGSNTPEFKAVDAGGIFGMAYTISKSICLGTRYSKGFVNISRNSGNSIKSSAFTFFLSYGII